MLGSICIFRYMTGWHQFISIDIAQSVMCAMGRIQDGLNRKYPPFPLLSYFPYLCQRWLNNHILPFIAYISREHWHFIFIIEVQCVQISGTLMPVDHVILKMLVRYALSSVCLRWSQLFQLYSFNALGCALSLPRALVIIAIMCTASYNHHRHIKIECLTIIYP